MIETAARIPTAVEDYLRLEERAGVKHEYVDGELYAMAGASARHNRIAGNAFFHFRAATRGGPCAAFIADMKLRVEAVNAFYYPDVMLCCDPADDHPLYKTAPCVVVEVVSPATAQIDRREKWQAYRRLVSLRAYVLVESERRQAEFYLREDDGGWRHGVLAEDAVLNLRCGPLSLSLGLDDLYEDVDLPPV
ncbi:MAG: Uma2 family endonuclease [Thiobacillaceae bacterium]|nr:Uma2 family endonuclease [Thiobacillaceae bacterium]